MSDFKIGDTVRLKAGAAYPCIVVAFYTKGMLTSEPSEFVVVASEGSPLTSPHVTFHRSLLQLVVSYQSDGPSVH